MYEFKLSESLFATKNKEIIMLTGSGQKTVGTIAPAGFGLSASHTGTRPAKYNAAGKALDFILVNRAIKCLEGEDNVYAEFSLGATTAKVVCNGVCDSYEGERLHGSAKFIPLVLYHLRTNSDNDELKNCYKKIKEEFETTGQASLADIVRFCDCFYYTIAAKMNNPYGIAESDLQIATVKAAIRSGQLKPFKAPLDGMTPSIYSEEPSAAHESSSTAPSTNVFDAIKQGDKIIPFNWSERQKLKIHPLEFLNDFVPTPEYYSILNKICVRMNKVNTRLDAGLTGINAIGKDYVNLMMVGKPGTGKTTLAYALGAATGMPVYSVPLNKDSESDVFEGMTKIIDGQLQFVSTDFLEAYTNGGIIILEEINLANPNVVMGTIGQAIEFPFVLMENGYKPIRRHPLCVIIGTMNVGTYGSASLNEALSSRFKTTYILDDPKDEDFIRILEKAGGNPKTCKWVYKVYSKILEFLIGPEANAEDVAMRLTMRGCIGALEGIEEGEPPKEAIRRTLIGKIAESDLSLADHAWEAVRSLPDLAL